MIWLTASLMAAPVPSGPTWMIFRDTRRARVAPLEGLGGSPPTSASSPDSARGTLPETGESRMPEPRSGTARPSRGPSRAGPCSCRRARHPAWRPRPVRPAIARRGQRVIVADHRDRHVGAAAAARGDGDVAPSSAARRWPMPRSGCRAPVGPVARQPAGHRRAHRPQPTTATGSSGIASRWRTVSTMRSTTARPGPRGRPRRQRDVRRGDAHDRRVEAVHRLRRRRSRRPPRPSRPGAGSPRP